MVIKGVTVNDKPLNEFFEEHPELLGETSQELQEELKLIPRYKKPRKKYKTRGRNGRVKKLTKLQIIQLKGIKCMETTNVNKVLTALFESDEISLKTMNEFFAKNNLQVNPKSSSAMMANAWNRLGPAGANLLTREKRDKSYVYKWATNPDTNEQLKPDTLEELGKLYRGNSTISKPRKSHPAPASSIEKYTVTGLPKNIDVNVNFHINVTFSFGQSH